MAPTVGRRADGAVLAIGSPGSDRIPTSIAQVLALHVAAGVPLDDAVRHPRVHVRLNSPVGDRADHEADLTLPDDLGLPTHQMPPHSMYFGGVAVAMATAERGLHAAGDPRRAGAVAVS
jgi:gamma-glutamyltranspeptidase/glutathione hydrolase